MRTENPSAPASAVARLRDQWVRARRSVLAQGPTVRWLAAAAALAAVAALVYLANLPSTGKYLGGGRQYSPEDIAKITRFLDAQQVEYRVVERRIDVASDRFDEAVGIVGKLDLDPPSLAEIRKKTRNRGIWESLGTTAEKEQRDLWAREEILETIIRKLGGGIVSAYVEINRTRTRMGVRPVTAATAFVWLETEGTDEVGPKTVQSIQDIIVASEPDLKRDAVTVLDDKGRHYLDAGNPEVGAISRTRAHEAELGQGILEQLDWIKGIRVRVQLVPPTAPGVAAAVVDEAQSLPDPKIGVNQPAALEPDPRPAAPVVPPPPARADFEPGLANVWVQVPISFYYLKAAPDPNPSPEDLQPYVSKTESLIRTAVAHVVAEGELGTLKIDTIPDNSVPRNSLVAPAVPESRHLPSWWIAAGAGGAVATVVVVVAFRLLAARRPKVPATAATRRAPFPRADPAEPGPGPSERVRELIRRNPEAAASVLNRWIGQGGDAA